MENKGMLSTDLKIKILAVDSVITSGERFVMRNLSEEAKDFFEEARESLVSLGILAKNPLTSRFVYLGTFVFVEEMENASVILRAGDRFFVKKIFNIGKLLIHDVVVEIIKKENKNLEEAFAEDQQLEQFFLTVERMLKKNKKFLFPGKKMRSFTVGELADYLVSFLPKSFFLERLDIFETYLETERLRKTLSYLDAFLSGDVFGKKPKSFSQNNDTKKESSDVEVFQLGFDKIKESLSKEVAEEIQREITSLSKTPASSGNYDYIQKWLEFVLAFFALVPTKDNQDIGSVWKILDESHYGLLEVKNRIFEELIVRRLNPAKRGLILCFVGPPGTGKTSMGKAIAESLGRNFVRISLGGVRDEAEIRGHRRTYVGALPGKIAEYILKSGSSNPLLMIDEIDKVGVDSLRGNLEAALLEVFDAEQNYAFVDKYVNIPIDISKIMIICTANTWEGILPPLQDRMELIRLSGYTFEEKINIAKKFLVERQRKENGLCHEKLAANKIIFSDKALSFIVGSYTDEAGVRNLEREISRVFRKVARGICMNKIKGGLNIEAEEVKKFLGVPKRLPDRIKETPSGVATGVAVTRNGGSLLMIESRIVNKEGSGKLELTGNLEKTTRESIMVALSFFRSRIKENVKEKTKNDIHVHVPAGGVPKDGPSAGVAIASALRSLFKNKPIKRGLVMTGEINLSGEVLPVGGIREKVLAAERAGATEFILPAKNKNNYAGLPLQTRKRMKFHLVETVDEVLDIAFERKK